MGRGSRRSGPYDHDEDYDYEVERPPRRSSYAPPSRSYRHSPPPRRRRRVWPALLAGCALGVVFTVALAAVVVFLAFRSSQGGSFHLGPMSSPRTFTKEDSVQVPLTTIAQMQICDKIGNVSVQVDPRASAPTVMTKKIVHMHSQADADQEFKRVAVEVQPPATIQDSLTCTRPGATPTATGTPVASNAGSNALTVNVTMPDGNGLVSTTSDAVDITIKLPPQALPSSGPTMLLDVEAPVGNITIDGVSGIFTVKGSTGNVAISHAILADGSHIETGQGNISFNGLLLASPNASAAARYYIQNELGNIDITLTGNSNITLDANTNVGAIHSDFNLPVNNNGGPVNYRGPLNPAAGAASPSLLILDVSTGDITIHKAPS